MYHNFRLQLRKTGVNRKCSRDGLHCVQVKGQNTGQHTGKHGILIGIDSHYEIDGGSSVAENCIQCALHAYFPLRARSFPLCILLWMKKSHPAVRRARGGNTVKGQDNHRLVGKGDTHIFSYPAKVEITGKVL